jgi:hypothetical protein
MRCLLCNKELELAHYVAQIVPAVMITNPIMEGLSLAPTGEPPRYVHTSCMNKVLVPFNPTTHLAMAEEAKNTE